MKMITRRALSLVLSVCLLLSLFFRASRVSRYAATLLVRINAGGSLRVRLLGGGAS